MDGWMDGYVVLLMQSRRILTTSRHLCSGLSAQLMLSPSEADLHLSGSFVLGFVYELFVFCFLIIIIRY